MASYQKTTLSTLGWHITLYDNQNAYKETLGEFDIPNWAIDNFNRNAYWKAKYNLDSEQTYSDLTLQKKGELRREIFNMWSEGIWEIIRQRIGLKLDVVGYRSLNDQQQNSLKLAIAYQINYWRVNLPYEIGATVTRISTNIQTTINASEFLTGFHALSARTRTAIVNAGLETYSLSNLVKNVYREDYLITEMNTLKEDISDLKTTAQTWTIPDDLLTRIEAANLYEPKNVGYITEINADAKYALKADILAITDGAFYDSQRVINDSVIEKKLESTNGDKLVERRKYNEFIIELSDNNDNIIHTLSFDSTGLKVDNFSFLNEGALNTRLSNYYTKTNIDTQFATVQADITDINSKYLSKEGGVATGYITTTQTTFNAGNQLVTKQYVDSTITGTGQFNASLYYNKNETDTKFYSKTDINVNYINKAKLKEIFQDSLDHVGKGILPDITLDKNDFIERDFISVEKKLYFELRGAEHSIEFATLSVTETAALQNPILENIYIHRVYYAAAADAYTVVKETQKLIAWKETTEQKYKIKYNSSSETLANKNTPESGTDWGNTITLTNVETDADSAKALAEYIISRL